MSSPTPHSDAPLDDDLVAYLDGELSPEESRRIEERLAIDELLRERLRELDQAWEALDSLPPATLRDDFARTTIEMVSVEAEKDLSRRQATQAAGNRRRALAMFAAGLLAALVGYLVVALLPDSNRRLVADLPVIMQVDLLTQVPDIDFLRRLSTVATLEQLANDEQRLERESSRATLVSNESAHERVQSIETLSPEEKANLGAQAERFWALSDAQQQRLRDLQRAIDSAPDRDELRQTLLAYGQWLDRRQAGERARLRDELDTDERLQRIAHLIQQDNRQAARKLSHEDAKRLREEIFTIAQERKPEWFDDDRNRKGRKAGLSFALVVRALQDDDSDDHTREQLTKVLSEAPRKHLNSFRSQADQRRQLMKWMWDSLRTERGPEALERFFTEELDNDQRARLLNLAPGQMEAELEGLYQADQLGGRGREWLPHFGRPWHRGRTGRDRPARSENRSRPTDTDVDQHRHDHLPQSLSSSENPVPRENAAQPEFPSSQIDEEQE